MREKDKRRGRKGDEKRERERKRENEERRGGGWSPARFT